MAKLKVFKDGVCAEVNVPSGSELKDVFDKNPSLPLKFGCRDGRCGVCAVEVLEGGENLTQQSADEAKVLEKKKLLPERNRLACLCAMNGDVEVRVRH